MLSGLMSMRLTGRKRGSEALEDEAEDASKAQQQTNGTPNKVTKSKPQTPGSTSAKRRPRARSRARTPKPEPIPETPEQAALSALKATVRSYPPKSFHDTLLHRLDSATPDQIAVVAALLDGLIPPPLLHCARCHHDYYEEDNGDRSCIMDHDDNSTSVEYGETTWGCCGNVTEDQEPPSGYCFMGKHCDDRLKARYREDYADGESDDGLLSCHEKRCKRRAAEKSDDTDAHVPVTRLRGERPPPSKKRKSAP